VEVSYLLVGPWRPHTSLSISRPLRGGLALRFHQSASVEALYCIVLPFVMITRKSVKGKHFSLTISVPTLQARLITVCHDKYGPGIYLSWYLPSVGPSAQASYCIICRPLPVDLRKGFAMYFCYQSFILYQSARP
jgi:hypothetical protein